MNAQGTNLHPVFAGILAGITAQPEQIKRAEYITALRKHDWQSEFADDMSAVRAGRESLKRLVELRAEIDPSGEVWNSVAPDGFKVDGVAA